MERCSAAVGEVIIRQRETTDDLYLIEVGQAVVQVGGRDGQPVTLATLGPGDYFGEIALITGVERTADVIALTAMTLLRLSGDAYVRYLDRLVEVDQQLTREALRRTHKTLRTMESG